MRRRRPLVSLLLVTVASAALTLPTTSAAAEPAPGGAATATRAAPAATGAPSSEVPASPPTTRDTCPTSGSGTCLRVKVPTVDQVVAGPPKATAATARAVVPPGLPACGFAPGTPVVLARYWSPNRTTACLQGTSEVSLISVQTGEVLGTEWVSLNEWFVTSPTTLRISHGIGVEVVGGTLAFTAGGMTVSALFPCPVTAPADTGCSTTQTGLAFSAILAKGQTNTTAWFEDIKVGSAHELGRSGMRNTLTVNFAAPGAVNVATVTLSPHGDVRCDDTTLIGGAGCVAPAFRPTILFDSAANPKVLPAAHHMKLAQEVLPGHPGRASDGYPLKRIPTGTEADANRNRACDNNPKYVGDGADSQCDEYPFATTSQTSSSAFSAMPVPSAANSSQGGLLAGGLKSNRVMVNDEYWVNPVVTDAKTGSAGAFSSLTSQFNAYGDAANCATWSGGDATNSVKLPNGQRAWFFSDSYLGTPAVRRNPFGFSMVHNSIVVQNGSSMRTVTGGNTCQESNQSKPFGERYAKAPAEVDGGFWWTGDQQLVGTDVVKFYYHGYPKDGSWVNDYGGVAKISASSLANSVVPVSPTPIKCSAGGPPVYWGTMTMKWTADGYWYIYGGDGSLDAAHRLYLARASSANLANPAAWTYYTGSTPKADTASWSASCAAAAPLPIGAGTPGGSVSEVNGTAWLVQFDYDNPNLFGPGTINAHPASKPWGFSSRKVPLYRPPTSSHSYPNYYLQYEARVQNGLTNGSDLVVGYNVNTSAVNTGCVDANNWDATIYRPRFFTTPPSWFNTYDAPFVTIPGQRTASTVATPGVHVLPKPLLSNPTAPPPAGAVLSGAGGVMTAKAGAAGAGKAAVASAIGDATDWVDKYALNGCPAVAPAKDLAATARNDGSVDLTWKTTGSDIWTYLYQCDTNTTTCAGGTSCVTDEFGGFSKQLGDLWLTVQAINYRPVQDAAKNGHTFAWYVCSSGLRSGYGGPSQRVSAKVTVPKPSAPAGLSGTRTTTTSATLRWSEVTFPTNANYIVPYYWDITAGGTSANPTFGQAAVGGTSLTVGGLVSGHKYGFYLVARNFAGDSLTSNVIQNI